MVIPGKGKGSSLAAAALLALFLFVNLCGVRFLEGWGKELTCDPVWVAVDPGTAGPGVLPRVTAFDRKGVELHDEVYVRGRWTLAEMFLSRLRLRFTVEGLEQLRSVTLAIGDSIHVYTREAFLREWTREDEGNGVTAFYAPGTAARSRSALGPVRNLLNWPGDWTVLRHLVGPPALVTVAGAILILLSLSFIPLSGRSAGLAGRAFPAGRMVLLCGLAAAVYAVIYFNRTTFDDDANPWGDAFEYQSIAVNITKGLGLNRVGMVGDERDYRFKTDARDTADWSRRSAESHGTFRAYRMPGYPAFLAGVYSVFGVSPLRAKEAQLLLLVLAAAALPLLGYWMWRAAGFYGGLLAGMVFLERWHAMPVRLYTEPLICWTVVVWAFIAQTYLRRPGRVTAGILGLASGAALLVKGDLIFLPMLAVLLLLWKAWRGSRPYSHAIACGLLVAAVIAPWSIYATRQSGTFTLLTTMANEILLDGNNELTVTDGGWHAEWRDGTFPDAFCNRPELAQRSALGKVMAFYAQFPARLPINLYAKIRGGFDRFPYARLALALMLWTMVRLLRSKPPREAGGRLRLSRRENVLITAGVVLVSVNTVVFLAAFGIVLVVLVARRKAALLAFPAPIGIVWGNFLLITLIIFGDPRFISVIDDLFALAALALLFSLVPGIESSGEAGLLAAEQSGQHAVAGMQADEVATEEGIPA